MTIEDELKDGLRTFLLGLASCMKSYGNVMMMLGNSYHHEASVNHFISNKLHFEEALLAKELQFKTALLEIAEKRKALANYGEEIPVFMSRDALSQLARSVEFKKFLKELESGDNEDD